MRGRFKEVLLLIVCYLTHASVYASQITLWTHLQRSDTVMEIVINLMSALCASMANTAFRLKNQDIVVKRVLVELLSGIGVGLVAGVIVYSMTKAADANVFLQLALVTIAGWGGSKVIETYVERHFVRRDGGK